MKNLKQHKSLFKIPLILFIIGLVFIFASGFAIWGVDVIKGPHGYGLSFIGYLVAILLGLVPLIGVILLIASACKILKVVFVNKEHPIRNSFVVHLLAVLGILCVVGSISVNSFFISSNMHVFLAWLILDLTMILLLTIVSVICLIKFIVELVKDWKLVRTAILETREIVGSRIIKK